jgi:hypothetical protein
MDEKNLKEVVVEDEDLLSDEDLQYFIENDNQEYYFNEYECLLIDNLY